MKSVVVDKWVPEVVWEPHMQTAPYQDGDLTWYELGTGAPQVVFLHGLSGCAKSWDDIPFRLEQSGVSSLVQDMPGHGDSHNITGNYTPQLLANVIPWLRQQYGVGSFHIVGHSLGGGVSLAAIDHHQSQIRSATLCSSGGLGKDIPPGFRLVAALRASDYILHKTLNKDVAQAWRAFGAKTRLLGMKYDALTELTADSVESLAEEARMKAFTSIVRNVCNLRGQTEYGQKAIESLGPDRVHLVTCEQDPVLGSRNTLQMASLTGAHLDVFAGKSHNAHLVEREKFANIVLNQVQKY